MKSDTRQEARPSSARLVIADDHDLIREGLRALLDDEPDLKVVGEAKDGHQALQVCRSLRPDLVLMDVRMPKTDGFAATRAIKEELPQTSVVMVTMHENPDYLLEAIEVGAGGYVMKSSPREQLVEAVRRTLNGGSPLDEELAMKLLVRMTNERKRSTRSLPKAKEHRDRMPEGITPREVEVLRLVAQGQTNPQIARNLSVTRGTVKNHVEHIIAKLGVSDRTQAAVRAIELGLLDSRPSDKLSLVSGEFE